MALEGRNSKVRVEKGRENVAVRVFSLFTGDEGKVKASPDA